MRIICPGWARVDGTRHAPMVIRENDLPGGDSHGICCACADEQERREKIKTRARDVLGFWW
jgi:hypothetical protein